MKVQQRRMRTIVIRITNTMIGTDIHVMEGGDGGAVGIPKMSGIW